MALLDSAGSFLEGLLSITRTSPEESNYRIINDAFGNFKVF